MPIFFLICLFLLPSFAFSFEPPSLTNFQMKIWNNLLYRENGESKISDPDFFLGSKNLSSQKLFEIHLKLIDDERITCKFPARFNFISHIVKRQIEFKNCKDFINFSDVTESNVISWIEQKLTNEQQTKIDKDIENQINTMYIKEDLSNLPWS